jgi:hypothetical protein
MRPKQSLAQRLASGCELPVGEIEAVLEDPRPASNLGRCWNWRNQLVKGMPMMKWEGRPQPVRRVVCGPLADNQRVYNTCTHPLCVNPDHSQVRIYNRILGLKTVAVPDMSKEVVADTLEDAAFMVYSREPPWDAAALAAEWDYAIELVQEAIDKIKAGEM